MGNLSGSTKYGNRKKEEVFRFGNEPREKSTTDFIIKIPAEFERARRRVLHRVPPQVRQNKKHIYDAMVVSLGPYHHGLQPQFRRAEELKEEVLNIVFGAKDKGFLRRKILEWIDEIRHFYGGLSRHEYGDEALAEMMLRDACFVLYYMEMADLKKCEHLIRRLGASGLAFIGRDFFVLENQIPLWLINLLVALIFGDDIYKSESFLCNYLSIASVGVDRLTRVPWKGKEDQEPLHLLEALNRQNLFVKDQDKIKTIESIKNNCHWIFKSKWSRIRKISGTSLLNMANCPFRSVTDLKAKGIHFRPSSKCFKDIKFTSYWFYEKIQLPVLYINNNTKVYFSNAVAFEMSPETDTDLAMTSYINFIKSLIESPEDVKELREKRILFSSLSNDEEVARMFDEIDTFGFYNPSIFLEVKMSIEEHCNNKAKTWMAELAYTYFRTPWTAIALFAAIFLLCLTFLQTYYTVNPRN